MLEFVSILLDCNKLLIDGSSFLGTRSNNIGTVSYENSSISGTSLSDISSYSDSHSRALITSSSDISFNENISIP